MKNKHIGPRFDDILKGEGTLESAELAAIKMAIAEQVAKEMKKKKLSQLRISLKNTANLPQQMIFRLISIREKYSDCSVQMEQVKLQLSRTPYPPPGMKLNPAVKNIFDFKFEDFTLENYQSHPAIKAPVAV